MMMEIDAPLLTDVLHAGGFRDITVEAIPLQYEYPSAAAFMDSRKETAGPLLTLIERLSPANRERMWAEIAADLRQFEGPHGFAGPGEVLLCEVRRSMRLAASESLCAQLLAATVAAGTKVLTN